MEFTSDFTTLRVRDGNESDILISAKFMQRENQSKFAEYMREVAAKLNTMQPYSDEMAEAIESAESVVQQALLAEKFMEEVSFS